MKIKLGTIIDSNQALASLASKQTIAKTAYRIAKTIKTIGAELELYEQQRKQLLEKFATLSADGVQYEFADGQRAKFDAEFNGLLDTEIELAITPIPLADLGDVKLTSAEMLKLDWMIAE